MEEEEGRGWEIMVAKYKSFFCMLTVYPLVLVVCNTVVQTLPKSL